MLRRLLKSRPGYFNNADPGRPVLKRRRIRLGPAGPAEQTDGHQQQQDPIGAQQ